MNMVSQNVQVIFVGDPTLQGNDGTEIILRYGLFTDPSPYLTGNKAVRVLSFPGLPLNINSPCS